MEVGSGRNTRLAVACCGCGGHKAHCGCGGSGSQGRGDTRLAVAAAGGGIPGGKEARSVERFVVGCLDLKLPLLTHIMI